MKKTLILASLLGALSLNAGVVKISSNITSDYNMTSDNTYILTDVIFVTNGATLSIQEGTIIRGEPKSASAYDPGTLVIARDGQIDAEGSPANPIIFTTAAVVDGNGDYDTTIDYSTNVDYTGKTFLDSDPADNPLTAGVGYTTTANSTSHIGTPGGKYSFDGDLGSNEHRGMWGGIIVLGNAPTNCMELFTTISLVADENDVEPGEPGYITTQAATGVVDGDTAVAAVLNDPFEGFIEGLDPATYGELGVYGGGNPNDSSGTIKYVRIAHGGTNIGADNEINGLTMGGVGFGTKLEYVEVYCNNDDGFEWFGGTVNSRYLVSLYNNDDSFDIDEGFTGLGQFWFSLQIDDGQNGDHGGEHDGVNGNMDNLDLGSLNGVAITGTGDNGIGIPVAYPTIYNATYINSGSGDQSLKFEDSFGCDYYNSIFVVNSQGRFNDVGSNMHDRIAVGDCNYVNNSVIYNSSSVSNTSRKVTDANDVDPGDPGYVTTYDSDFNSSLNTSLTGNGNVFTETNPLNNALGNQRVNVDPRATGAAPSGVELAPVSATFFIAASYAGAFNPTETSMWTDDWTVFDANHALPTASR